MSEAGGSSCSDTKGIYSKGHKRLKTSPSNRNCDEMMLTSSMHTETLQKSPSSISVVVGYTDPPVAKFLEELDNSGKYGIKEDMEAFYARTDQILGPLFAQFPALSRKFLEEEKKQSPPAPKFKSPQAKCLALNNFIDLEDDCVDSKAPAASSPIAIIDSDEEQSEDQRPFYHVDEDVLTQPSYPVEEVILTKPNYSVQDVILAAPTHPVQDAVLAQPSEQPSKKDFEERHCVEEKALVPEASVSVETKVNKNAGEYMGLEDDETSEGNDSLDDALWMEVSMLFESSKEVGVEPSTEERMSEGKEGSGCEHFFVLKDDIGLVCRICGLIDRRIDTIFEFQYNKGKRSTRTYVRESQNANNTDSTVSFSMDFKSTRYELMATDFFAHPRHQKKMKQHQVDGFNFLCSNLMTDNPGGCILAHAPGAGKTFLTISFVQSFLARFPDARPLVVLPRGLLDTWKKEFKKWQVEDIPLHDFYTSKADNRSQQLDVLKQWVEQKSILFLGYQQFSTIICDIGNSKASEQCREILLKSPSLLILDEGHTPRNDDTNQFQSLARVQTPLKVVLSGTIYQNHVKEVFNLLNLVRPKFLNLDTSKDLVKRIMSRVQISGIRKLSKSGADAAFYDLVEHTLKNDEDLRRKAAVIQDLREMTRNVLHYYKGDFLDELPGLVEFTVLLNLSSRQKAEVVKVKKLEWMNRNSVGSLVYMHPELKYLAQKYPSTERGCPVDNMKMDGVLEKLNLREGVKAKFFLNMLGLCESNGEKLLVFSQYLLPLKLMERLAVKEKGWRLDKEIFVVTGETNSKHKEWSMEQFNDSPDAKVFFGSIKACGEGISLVGASRVLIMDVQLNPSVTRQAIGRAFRPGQKKKVFVYRLVAADSPEVDDHLTCFKKEVISKVWFEWDESYGHQDCFGMKDVDVNECGDMFFESQLLKEDIKVLQKR